ncbi:MAG: anti-sigma factor [Burkholderiaceae bacterium]
MSKDMITDQDLRDLIAGRLDAAQAAELNQQISANESLSDRFQALSLVQESDLTSMDQVLRYAPTERLSSVLAETVAATAGKASAPTVQSRVTSKRTGSKLINWRSWLGLPIASALSASIATAILTITLIQSDTQTLNWQDSVAVYQRLYTTETLNAPAPSADEVRQTATRLARISDMPIAIPDLSTERLTFKRGQILQFEERALVQLAYLSDEGVPVAICLTRTGASDHDLQLTNRHGLNTAVWTQNGISVMAIGDVPAEQLTRISQSAKAINAPST